MLDSYTANPPLRFRPLLLALHLQTALLLFSLAKYPNSAFLLPATLPHHLHTHPLLLPLPLISQSSPLPQNPKSTRSCPNKQSDSDPIPTWLLKECSSLLVPQSPLEGKYSLESTDPLRKRNLRPSSNNHCPQAVLLLIYYRKTISGQGRLPEVCLHWKKSRFTAFLDSNVHTRLAIVTENELGLAFPPRNLPKKFRPDPSTFYLVIMVTNKQTNQRR